jgi:hypothetical protein
MVKVHIKHFLLTVHQGEMAKLIDKAKANIAWSYLGGQEAIISTRYPSASVLADSYKLENRI